MKLWVLVLVFFVCFFQETRSYGLGCAKWTGSQRVHASALHTQGLVSCGINLQTLPIEKQEVRLLGVLIQHPLIREGLDKYFGVCYFGLLNLYLYLCNRRSVSEYLYLEYIYLFRVTLLIFLRSDQLTNMPFIE